METPVSRHSSEGELQMRLTHTFNKSKPGTYCTWHRAEHAGRAQQTWLTITTGTNPETVKQRHASGTVWNDWCRHLWGSHTEAASYWRNVYTQTGSGTEAGLPWESNQMLPRKELRPHTAGCMPVMGWLFPSREQVKQVSPHNRLQAEHKSRMLFQKAPWTALGIKSAVQSLGENSS